MNKLSKNVTTVLQFSCLNIKIISVDVEELTCPIPQCPMPTGGCVHS